MSTGAAGGDATAAGALTSASAFALVSDAVALVCEVESAQLTRATGLVTDLAADSLALVEIVEVTEAGLRALGSTVVFDDEDLDSLLTVGDIADYLLERQSAPGRALAGV